MRERSAAGIGMTSQRTRDRLVEALARQGVRDERVLRALREVPRHLFVDEALASRAYENNPLPIGEGQTISQPWVVARMSELLVERATPSKVLEVGTGSGFQAAILAAVVEQVFSLERIESLCRRARANLRAAGVPNVAIRHGDGYYGWPENAPYGGIICTAAPEELPQALLDQLADGGRLVAPLGGQGFQELVLVERQGDDLTRRRVTGVAIGPMIAGRS